MLLVDNDHAEPGKFDRVLDDRVRADGELGRARRDRFECRALLFGLHAAGQPGDFDAERLQPTAQLARMLLGENFSGRHERGLVAGIDRLGRGERRHDRLAAADVALQQTLHWVRHGHVGADLGPHATLSRGQRKRQRRLETRHQ